MLNRTAGQARQWHTEGFEAVIIGVKRIMGKFYFVADVVRLWPGGGLMAIRPNSDEFDYRTSVVGWVEVRNPVLRR